MITEAKTEYKSNLALAMCTLTMAEYFNTRGNDWYPTPIFYNVMQASTKPSYSVNIFIQYMPPVISR